MEKGYSLDGDCIVINRDLTELDLFVKKFLEILRKYSDYLIVSGFVSICSGRTRATEDVDVLVSRIEMESFKKLFDELNKEGFWCYQGDDFKEVYSYVEGMHAIRFAEINTLFPNIEFIPIDESKIAKFYEFTHPQRIRIGDFEFKIPPIEFEILYKEIILAGDKDMQDAAHLRSFFSDILKDVKFKEFEPIIKGELIK